MALQNSKGNTLDGCIKYRCMKKCVFRPKWIDRSESFSMTLSDLERQDASGPVFPAVLHTLIQGRAQGFSLGEGKTEEPKAESGVGFFERGSNPFPPARESGERYELPRGGAPAAQRFSTRHPCRPPPPCIRPCAIVYRLAIKFGTGTQGERTCFGGHPRSSAPIFGGGGPNMVGHSNQILHSDQTTCMVCNFLRGLPRRD